MFWAGNIGRRRVEVAAQVAQAWAAQVAHKQPNASKSFIHADLRSIALNVMRRC